MSVIVSPVSGVVVSVDVTVGQSLEPADVVAVLESMKMEIPVTAERACSVARLRITVGDTVSEGNVLLDVDG